MTIILMVIMIMKQELIYVVNYKKNVKLFNYESFIILVGVYL